MPNSKLIVFLDRNLGRCPRCMKIAFISAVASWAAFLVLWPLLPFDGKWLSLVPVAFTALWVTHASVYGSRVLNKLRAEFATAELRPVGASRVMNRRRLIGLMGTAAGFTLAAAVWLPNKAYAAGHPCGEGKVCPDDAPNCCSRTLGKCCNGGWACVPLGKCYADLASARADCGTGEIWSCF